MNAAASNNSAMNSSASANANTTTAAAANKNVMMGGRRGKKGTRKAGRKGRGTRKMRGGAPPSTLSVPAAASAMAASTLSKPMLGGGKVPAVGSKAQVWHGTAKHTAGGLTKKDLMKHKGRIVSKKKHALGKKAFKRLVKAGFKPKKGTFKLFRK